MDTTGTAEFRAKMKEWFDAAEVSPVKINRPTGKAVILIGQEQYDAMSLELQEYRDVIRGLMAVAEGKTQPFSKDALVSASKAGKANHKNSNAKKAVG